MIELSKRDIKAITDRRIYYKYRIFIILYFVIGVGINSGISFVTDKEIQKIIAWATIVLMLAGVGLYYYTLGKIRKKIFSELEQDNKLEYNNREK